jgi:hypothetical protein
VRAPRDRDSVDDMRGLAGLLFVGALSVACGKATPKPTPAADPAVSAASPASPASPASAASPAPIASASAARPAFTPCGALDCRAYDDLATAFEATLRDAPLVVAVGEAHAKRGFEWVDTSAKRFTAEILPTLGGRTSDLLLELMAPAQGCEQAKKATNERLGKIAENQAAAAPNEYVVLGKAAEKLGIKVSQLHPSCKQLADIAKSKSPSLTVLQTIAALIAEDARRAVEGKRDEKLFVIYGGAFHGEPEPPPERAEFSFAAPLAKAAKGRYVSVHLFVREYVDPTWDLWEWYPHFDARKYPDKVVLLHPKPNHFVILTAAAPKRAE